MQQDTEGLVTTKRSTSALPRWVRLRRQPEGRPGPLWSHTPRGTAKQPPPAAVSDSFYEAGAQTGAARQPRLQLRHSLALRLAPWRQFCAPCMQQRCQSSRERRGGHRARRKGHAIGEGRYQSRFVRPALPDYRHRYHSDHLQHPSISRGHHTKIPSTQSRDNRSTVAHPKSLLKAMGDGYIARGGIYTDTALQKVSVCREKLHNRSCIFLHWPLSAAGSFLLGKTCMHARE